MKEEEGHRRRTKGNDRRQKVREKKYMRRMGGEKKETKEKEGQKQWRRQEKIRKIKAEKDIEERNLMMKMKRS